MEGLKRILILDDDKNSIKKLDSCLNSAGYVVHIAERVKNAMKVFLEFNPDLVLLDINRKDINGIKLLQCIKKKKDVPVIILTAKNDIFHKVVTFEMGADDYVIKPFSSNELTARINAVLRRCLTEKSENNNIIKVDNLFINPLLHTVRLNKKNIKMTEKEFQLFYILAKNKNKVITKTQILYSIWGSKYIKQSNIIDRNIDKIREKIKSNKTTWNIENVYDVGYRFFYTEEAVNC